MKKTLFFLLAAACMTAPLSGTGRLSSVSVSENGTVMLSTGSPNEFKSFWTGETGSCKMIIELPGVTVDNAAKVLGNLTANRGIKSVRFSQFKTEPPVARVVIETSERLSYSWSTKPEGVELHFMLPAPSMPGARTAPAAGLAVPSTVFSQATEREKKESADKHPIAPPPAAGPGPKPTAATAPIGPPAGVVKASTPSTQAANVKTTSTPAGSNQTPAVSPISKTGSAIASKATGPATTGSVNKAVVPAPTSAPANQSKPTGAGSMSPSGPTADKNTVPVKPASTGPQKDSAAPTGSVSTSIGKTGTTLPAKNTPPGGPQAAPASGETGMVVKPSSAAPTNITAPGGVTAPGSKPAAPATTLKVAGTSTQTGSPSTTGKSPQTTVKSTANTPPAPGPAATAKPGAMASKPAAPAMVKPSTPAPATAATPSVKPVAATDSVDQKKFKEQLKKALGKLEAPKQVEPAPNSSKDTLTMGKAEEPSFQEQLKKALNPAQSLTDTGEVAGVDDIDTDLPATEEEEEPMDTSFAFPGATFMQVSPSRKVIRYHSEGRRDPFSPLTGRDRYASGKKRRAVPAAEQLRLVGIMRSLAGNKALLEDGEGNGYILAPGDRVRNGYLVSVSENKVLFQVTEYGWTKTVAMELGNLE